MFFTRIAKMKITPIQMFRDNYAYLLECSKTGLCAIVDPAEPKAVLPHLKSKNLTAILTTHHHNDHSMGNREICSLYNSLQVYGGDERVPNLSKKLTDKEQFQLGNLEITALHTPCHTSGSISYYVFNPDTLEKAVFTGDTLFIGGCGRFFEGTANEMYHSLINVLGNLPPDTKVYCGHEYTKSNLLFAASIEPNNPKITAKLQFATENAQTVPSTIAQEFEYNPFMRVENKQLQELQQIYDPIELMKRLRELKNKF
jgi:hydroxyacylglutathione hydrolase